MVQPAPGQDFIPVMRRFRIKDEQSGPNRIRPDLTGARLTSMPHS